MFAIAWAWLNAGLAACPLDGQMNGEGASPSKGPDALIVATPSHAKLQTIILILDSKAVANRLPAVGRRGRILILVGEIDHRGSEDRPIASDEDSGGNAKFLTVAQVLDAGVDIAVELEVADLCIGLAAADRQVDFVPPNGKIAFVDAVAVSDVDKAAVANSRSS